MVAFKKNTCKQKHGGRKMSRVTIDLQTNVFLLSHGMKNFY